MRLMEEWVWAERDLCTRVSIGTGDTFVTKPKKLPNFFFFLGGVRDASFQMITARAKAGG